MADNKDKDQSAPKKDAAPVITMTEEQLDRFAQGIIKATMANAAAQSAPTNPTNGQVIIQKDRPSLRDRMHSIKPGKLLEKDEVFYSFTVGKFISAYKDASGQWVFPPDDSDGVQFKPSHDVKSGEGWLPVCVYKTRDMDMADFVKGSPEFGYRIVTSIDTSSLTAAATMMAEDVAIFDKYRTMDRESRLRRVTEYNANGAGLPATGNLEVLRRNLAAHECAMSRKRQQAAAQRYFNEAEKIEAMKRN